MRLLVISELFLPTKGGTAVWFDEVYRRLGGKEIHIVTADVPGAEAYDRDHPNSVHRLKFRRYAWLRPESLVMYLKLLSTSLNLGLRHDFVAVHAGRVLPEGLIGWIVARVMGKPLVVYAHGEEITTWRQAAKYKVMRFTYCQADITIANSEFTRNELVKLGVAPDKIRLVSPGVDIVKFRPDLPCDDLRAGIGVSSSQRLILSVGRLSRRKGFDQVIKSLPMLLEKGLDVHYAIVGIGDDVEYLRELAIANGVEARLHLLGHVETADLPRWYNACDVFAMPNREIDGDTEGFGMVFLEAAACAKPTLAGIAGGAGTAVLDGHTGMQVDGKITVAIANALATMICAGEGAIRMGVAGRERVVSDFSWEAVARRTAELQFDRQ